MNIGMITCNYFMRIYGNSMPDDFDWGKMVVKYRAEFHRDDFLKLAGEIREMGYENLEIWEPTFSHFVYSEDDARAIAADLKAMGFQSLAYCIGGWSAGDVPHIERGYRFAKALGSKVVTGCVPLADVDKVLPELERCGLKYGLRYAIENHPAPNIEDPKDVARVIADYKTVGANFDAGIYNMQNFDVIEGAKLLRDRIYHVHFKDTVKGGHDCLPIGDGDAPLAALVRLLRDWNYDGMVSVEFEYNGDPAPGLVRSLAYIRGALA